MRRPGAPRAGAAAMILAVSAALAVAACAQVSPPAPAPAEAGTPTPGPGDRLTHRDAAIARAYAVAEIGGPFVLDEAIEGTYGALDVEAHNALGNPGRQVPSETAVWRVTFRGPAGSESVLLASIDGSVVGLVAQGH